VYDFQIRFFDEKEDSGDEKQGDKCDSKGVEVGHTKKRFKDVVREQILDQMEREEKGLPVTNEDTCEPTFRASDVASSEKLAHNEELREAFKTTEPDEDDDPFNDFW